MLFAAAFFVVEVRTAVRAKPAAIAAADDLHGDREIHLLGQHVGEEKPIALEERDFGVVEVQVKLIVGAMEVIGR